MTALDEAYAYYAELTKGRLQGKGGASNYGQIPEDRSPENSALSRAHAFELGPAVTFLLERTYNPVKTHPARRFHRRLGERAPNFLCRSRLLWLRRTMPQVRCSAEPIRRLREATLARYGKLHGRLLVEMDQALIERAEKIRRQLQMAK